MTWFGGGCFLFFKMMHVHFHCFQLFLMKYLLNTNFRAHRSNYLGYFQKLTARCYIEKNDLFTLNLQICLSVISEVGTRFGEIKVSRALFLPRYFRCDVIRKMTIGPDNSRASRSFCQEENIIQ